MKELHRTDPEPEPEPETARTRTRTSQQSGLHTTPDRTTEHTNTHLQERAAFYLCRRVWGGARREWLSGRSGSVTDLPGKTQDADAERRYDGWNDCSLHLSFSRRTTAHPSGHDANGPGEKSKVLVLNPALHSTLASSNSNKTTLKMVRSLPLVE